MNLTSPVPIVSLLLVFTFSLVHLGGAQDGFDAGVAGSPEELFTFEQIRFDVDFPDSSVIDAFEFINNHLEEAGVGRLNIVFSKEAEDIFLPSMTLRQITFSQFVSFINRIGGAAGTEGSSGMGAGDPSFSGVSGPRYWMSESDGIWYFWAESSGDANEPSGTKAEDSILTTVFALEGDTEAILGLIEETFGESRQHSERPEPSLKFHEPSSTLIVSATIADLEMIEEVIQVMHVRFEQEQKLSKEIRNSEMAQEIKVLQRKLEAYERSNGIKVLEAELDEAREMYREPHPKIMEIQKQIAKALEQLKNAR